MGGVVRRKPEALWVAIDVSAANGPAFPDHQTQQPVPARRVADPLAGGFVESRGDEPGDARAIFSEDAKRGVAGADHLPGGVHYLLQHLVEVVTGQDRNTGGQQPFESLPDAGCFGSRGHTG